MKYKLSIEVVFQSIDVGFASLQTTLQISEAIVVSGLACKCGYYCFEIVFSALHLFLQLFGEMVILFIDQHSFESSLLEIFEAESHPG